MGPVDLSSIIETRADHPFLIDSIQGIGYTYRDFHRRACALAGVIRRGGITRGERVAIFAHNAPEFVAAYFACLYLGATAVPVNPQLHDNDVRFILDRCSMTALLYSAKTKARCLPFLEGVRFGLCLGTEQDAGGSNPCWSMRDSVSEDASDWDPFDDISPKDLFSITFTSGTTGLPKGVAHTVGNLLNNAAAFNKALGFDDSIRMYHVFNMAYMAGFLNTLLCPFLAGGAVVVGQAFDVPLALRFWDVPIKYGVNTLWLVPTMLKILLKMDRGEQGRKYSREHIKTVCVGTAQLQPRLKQEFEEVYGVTLHESYGLSELLFITSNNPTIPFRPGSAGRALQGVEIQIAGEAGDWLPADQTGEVLVRTRQAMAGYLNYESGLPDAKTVPEWFPTGDIGRLSEDGYLYITDRKKDLVIRGGLNISPRAVEIVLERHPEIEQSAVVGLPHEYYGEEVAAAVRLRGSARLADVLESIKHLCKESLDEVSRPTSFFEVTEFPLGTTGKLHKGMLREKLIAMRKPE